MVNIDKSLTAVLLSHVVTYLLLMFTSKHNTKCAQKGLYYHLQTLFVIGFLCLVVHIKAKKVVKFRYVQ